MLLHSGPNHYLFAMLFVYVPGAATHWTHPGKSDQKFRVVRHMHSSFYREFTNKSQPNTEAKRNGKRTSRYPDSN